MKPFLVWSSFPFQLHWASRSLVTTRPRWPICVINSVVNNKLLCCTLPPTQHQFLEKLTSFIHFPDYVYWFPWVVRGTVWLKCFAKDHNAFTGRALTTWWTHPPLLRVQCISEEVYTFPNDGFVVSTKPWRRRSQILNGKPKLFTLFLEMRWPCGSYSPLNAMFSH